MKESLLVEKIEPLLSHLSQQESIEQQLVEWLHQRFDPKSPNSLWDKLSQSAKQHLRKILGNATYQDFQQWVGLLLKALPLQDWEKNQLSRRSEFWSNYSERFERFRILLPSESIRVLGNSISQEDYDQLLDDGSSPTEIGIFDIGGYFIVEFFRGPGSEVRIFNKRDIDIDLCSAKDLSPKRIRSLSAADVHDHKFIWQSSCEKWLREMRILPNSGVEYFKGLSRVHGKYSPSTGLPSPNATDQTNRDKQLQKWRRDIEDLEQEARKYYAADRRLTVSNHVSRLLEQEARRYYAADSVKGSRSAAGEFRTIRRKSCADSYLDVLVGLFNQQPQAFSASLRDQGFNHYPVAQTSESYIEMRGNFGQVGQGGFILEESSASDFWIVEEGSNCFLFPSNKNYITEPLKAAISASFETIPSRPSTTRYLRLIKPAKVSTIGSNSWKLVQKGKVSLRLW